MIFAKLVSGVTRQRDTGDASGFIKYLAVFCCLGFSVSCSTSNGIDPKGSFSNASLNGRYTYVMSGTRFGQVSGNGLFQEAGVFLADGDGHISAGLDDLVQGNLVSESLTGSYSIEADGTGTITLTVGGNTIQWVVTLASESQVYLVEFDQFGTGGGSARKQSLPTVAMPPSGSFAFRTHNAALAGSVTKVGSFTLNADGTLFGNEDVLRQGILIAPSISGAMSPADANGRGTITFLEDTGIQSNFRYYVVDANTVNLLQIDANSLGEGRAELRTISTFDNSTLQNAFVYRSGGDTPSSVGGANSIGTFTTDGNGHITAGSHDSMQDGTPVSNDQVTGIYSIDGRGHMNLVLAPQGFAPIEEVGWLVNSQRGFFLVNSPDRVEDGRFDQQQGAAFAGASLRGQFGFYLSGYDTQTPPLVSKLGVIAFDGQGTATFRDYLVNRGGVTTRKGGLSGNYNVTANGRISASVPGVTQTLIGYLINVNSGYLLVADPGSEQPGKLGQVAQP